MKRLAQYEKILHQITFLLTFVNFNMMHVCKFLSDGIKITSKKLSKNPILILLIYCGPDQMYLGQCGPDQMYHGHCDSHQMYLGQYDIDNMLLFHYI